MSCLPHILWSLIFKIRVLIFLATCSHLNSIPTRILFYVEPAAVNYIELKRFAAIEYHEPAINPFSVNDEEHDKHKLNRFAAIEYHVPAINPFNVSNEEHYKQK